QIAADERKPEGMTGDDEGTVHRTKPPSLFPSLGNALQASRGGANAILAQEISRQWLVIFQIDGCVERPIPPLAVGVQRMIEVKAVGRAPPKVQTVHTSTAHQVGNEGGRPRHIPGFRGTLAIKLALLLDMPSPALLFLSHRVPVALEQMEDSGITFRHRLPQHDALRTALVDYPAAKGLPLAQRQLYKPLTKLLRIGDRRPLQR